jgi:hypothetical protein
MAPARKRGRAGDAPTPPAKRDRGSTAGAAPLAAAVWPPYAAAAAGRDAGAAGAVDALLGVDHGARGMWGGGRSPLSRRAADPPLLP